MSNITQPISAPQEMLNHISSSGHSLDSRELCGLFERYFDRWDATRLERWTEADWTGMQKICNLLVFNFNIPLNTNNQLRNSYSCPVNYVRFYNLFLEATSPSLNRINVQTLIHLAKAYAQQEDIHVVIKNISKFGIDQSTAEGQRGLFELFEICAERGELAAISNFPKFGINLTLPGAQQRFLKIIKKSCEKNASEIVIKNFQNFKIDPTLPETQAAIFEIIKICTKTAPQLVVENFSNFGVDIKLPGAQASVFEIIKICAERKPSSVVDNFRNFRVNPKLPGAQALIFEIIKICAEKGAYEMLVNFPKFGIDLKLPGAQALIFEITKICAEKGQEIPLYFQSIGIDSKLPGAQAAIFEIIKICATKNSFLVVENFSNFEIDPKLPGAQESIFEIIKICAKVAGEYVAVCFPDFGINPLLPGAQQEIMKIAKICAKTEFKGNQEYIPNFGIDANTIEGLETLIELAKACIYESQDERIHFTPTDLKWLKTIIQSADKNSNLQWQLIFQTTKTLLQWNSELSEDQVLWVTEKQGLLQKLFALRAPYLRDPIARSIVTVAKSPLAIEIMDKSSLTLAGKYREASLIQILCASLGAEGVHSATLIDRLNNDLYKSFKDISSIKALLQMLLLLEASALDPQSKQVVLDKLTQVTKRSIVSEMRAITTILELKEDLILKERQLFTDTFSSVATAALNRHLPPMEVENLPEKWQRTFGMSRNPQAITTYVSKMNTLGDQNVMRCLGKFISSVLNGTFTDDRYSLQTQHLKKVQAFLPRWRTNFEQDLETQALDQVIFAPLKWLKLKLTVDNHLGNLSTTYPELARYLSDDPEEERKTDPELKRLERLAIELANSTDSSKQLQLLQRLEKIATGDFLNDIKAEITKLQQPLLPRRGLRAVNTDNPFHLLLAGTDVHGSCQNVNGTPAKNCGLLGYLMNGQTRLLAIVDERDRIVTRAIFRLLGDEKNQRPVLFFERVYGDPRYQSVLEKLAQEKANEMGLVLTSLDGKGGNYGSSIASLDGVAPFEYCDATATGVQMGSRFTINSAKILGSPSESTS